MSSILSKAEYLTYLRGNATTLGQLPYLLDSSSEPMPTHAYAQAMSFMVHPIALGYILGVDSEIEPLLALARKYSELARAGNHMPAEPGERAVLLDPAAMCEWFAHNADDHSLCDRTLDLYEGHLRTVYLDRKKKADIISLNAYMGFALQAGAYERAAAFYEYANGNQKSARSPASERGVANAACLAYLRGESDAAALMVTQLLKRQLSTWLVNGWGLTAAIWLKCAHWSRADAQPAPADVMRFAHRYVTIV